VLYIVTLTWNHHSLIDSAPPKANGTRTICHARAGWRSAQ